MKRLDRAKLGSLLCLVGACAAPLGCSAQAPSGEASNPNESEPTGSDTANAVVDPTGQKHTLCGAVRIGGHVEPETYSFPLMNRKLQDYPEFASAIGMTGVSSCEDARRFMPAYNDYLAAHPRFDDDSPSKEELVRQWAQKGVVDPAPKVEKIFAGVANDDENVVRIVRVTLPAEGLDGQSYSCSASRLAGPLFLTAAHCLPNVVTTNPVKNMDIWIKRVRADGGIGYYGGGVTVPTASPFLVDGMRPSGYMGTGDKARDIAVIHVRPASQKLLEADTGTWSTGLFLSTRAAKPGDTEDLYGWGLSTDTELPQNTILRLPDHPVKVGTVENTWFTIPNLETSSTNSVKMCVGDSGGPARLAASGSGNINGVMATRSDPDGMTRDQGCAPLDSVQSWVRVDMYINEIEQWISQLQKGLRNPAYKCHFHAPTAALDPEAIESYIECLGTN